MAAVTGTVTTGSVHGFTNPAGNQRNASNEAIESCFIGVKASGTYASGDGISIANVHTAIAAGRKDGKTIAVKSAAWASYGLYSGSKIGAKTVATSSNTITALLTTDAAAGTEWANGAMTTAAFTQDLVLFVTYSVADAA